MSNFNETLGGIEFTVGNTSFEAIIKKETNFSRAEGKMHNHYVYELLFVVSGRIVVSHGHNEYVCNQNELLYLPRMMQHISRYENATFFSIGVSVRNNSEAKQRTEDTYSLFERIFDDEIRMLVCTKEMRRFFDAYDSGMDDYNALSYYLVQNELRRFFILLSEEAIKERNIPVEFVRPLGMVHFIINKRLCFENFETTKLKDLSKELYISERQLSRVIKQIFGVPFRKRKLQLRIETAKVYLEESSETLDAIASRLNFYDVASFARAFKRETGLTPTQYRKRATTQGDDTLAAQEQEGNGSCD